MERLTDLYYHENGVVNGCEQFNKYVKNKKPEEIQNVNNECCAHFVKIEDSDFEHFKKCERYLKCFEKMKDKK